MVVVRHGGTLRFHEFDDSLAVFSRKVVVTPICFSCFSAPGCPMWIWVDMGENFWPFILGGTNRFVSPRFSGTKARSGSQRDHLESGSSSPWIC